MRLDTYLFDKSFVTSRTRGSNLIALGRVSVNGVIVKKASFDVKETDLVSISEDYDASLGGIKLSHALEKFNVQVADKVCLDVGASNGGFTDILLKNGAKRVYALDVGECALPDRLKSDNRVIIMDRTNARDITFDRFDPVAVLAVIDVSFISLTLVLDAVKRSISPTGEIIALIKPQFECSKRDLNKKGILLDVKKRNNSVMKVKNYAEGIGLSVERICEAPHPFDEKNQEYLIYLKCK